MGAALAPRAVLAAHDPAARYPGVAALVEGYTVAKLPNMVAILPRFAAPVSSISGAG